MTHKLRKIRKKRGSRTQGYGRVGQHRAGGSRGGKGKAGMHKHRWSYVLRYEPDYFKKDRFKPPRGRIEKDIINLKELAELAARLSPRKTTEKEKAVVDLKEMGVDKLLGEGTIAVPLTVHVPSCSESALRKIEEAGGKVITDES